MNNTKMVSFHFQQGFVIRDIPPNGMQMFYQMNAHWKKHKNFLSEWQGPHTQMWEMK